MILLAVKSKEATSAGILMRKRDMEGFCDNPCPSHTPPPHPEKQPKQETIKEGSQKV